MSARPPTDTLLTELRDLNAALEEQWKRRFNCPACGKSCRPDLERDAFTHEWRIKMHCHECGFTGEGKLARGWSEVAS